MTIKIKRTRKKFRPNAKSKYPIFEYGLFLPFVWKGKEGVILREFVDKLELDTIDADNLAEYVSFLLEEMGLKKRKVRRKYI